MSVISQIRRYWMKIRRLTRKEKVGKDITSTSHSKHIPFISDKNNSFSSHQGTSSSFKSSAPYSGSSSGGVSKVGLIGLIIPKDG